MNMHAAVGAAAAQPLSAACPVYGTFHSARHAAAQGIRKKRLFVCCDGTWSDGINNATSITNVSRLARSIKSVSDDGYLQVVYYDNGVGNGTNRLGQGVDGATGRDDHESPYRQPFPIVDSLISNHGAIGRDIIKDP